MPEVNFSKKFFYIRNLFYLRQQFHKEHCTFKRTNRHDAFAIEHK